MFKFPRLGMMEARGGMLKKLLLIAILVAGAAQGQDKALTLAAPSNLTETGFLKHLLPRFSLKHGVRITLAEDGAGAVLGPEGTPVFRQGDTVWRLSQQEDPDAEIFEAWLLSDVGKRTIESFELEGVALFSADVGQQEIAAAPVITGDVVKGEELSLTQCGRCHVVNEKNRMKAIGSTPSFGLMRNFSDWRERFEGFYALRPHPAFTQVADVTAPFEEHLPSPIAPLEVTLDDIDAIVAYVASIEPADLGAPMQAGGAFQSP